MNLIVDIGNTSTKLAVYDKGQKLRTRRLEETDSRELEMELINYSIEKVIISSVKRSQPQ
ncbi:MAG: type III pantothenate kinase [Bacteroidales bacterium]|nr:type III pantothenate kinase [Bacteroidales bacterium]